MKRIILLPLFSVFVATIHAQSTNFTRVQMGGPWIAAENTQVNVYRSGGAQQGGRVGNLGAAYYESASMGTGTATVPPSPYLSISNFSLSISNPYASSGGLSLEWWLTPYKGANSGYVKMTKGLPALVFSYPAVAASTNYVSVRGEARVTWRTGFNSLIVCQYAKFPGQPAMMWWTGAKTDLPGAAYYDN